MIQTLVPLDREFVPNYWLTVLAVDRGSVPLSSVTEVYIEVTDVNDNPPRMSRPVFYPSIQEDAPLGTSVLQLDAWDPDSSSKGKLTFNITSGNHMGFFIIHPFTGKSPEIQADRDLCNGVSQSVVPKHHCITCEVVGNSNSHPRPPESGF